MRPKSNLILARNSRSWLLRVLSDEALGVLRSFPLTVVHVPAVLHQDREGQLLVCTSNGIWRLTSRPPLRIAQFPR